MYIVNLNDNPHHFEKLNLVTQLGGYDTLKCKICGVTGKTISLATIALKGSYSERKVKNCSRSIREMRTAGTDRKIKITICRAQGDRFSNLTPESEHIVISCPKGENPDPNGIWVMGNGEAVKVLNNEFEYLDN